MQKYTFCIDDSGKFFYINENYPQNYRGTRICIVKYGEYNTLCFYNGKDGSCLWDIKKVLILC